HEPEASAARALEVQLNDHAPVGKTMSVHATLTASVSEGKAAAYRARRDHRLAEGVQESPEGTPAGAMRRHDLLQIELLEMGHGVGDQPLHDRPGQMEATEHSVQRDIRKRLARAQQDIDDASMRAHAEDDQPLAFHMDGQVALVQDQGVRLPWLIFSPSTHMIRPSPLEARHPRNLPAEIEAAVQ